jgi:hypothetical protein
MSRLHVFLAIVALTCIAIGSTIAWSNIAGSTGARAYVTKADFDQAFADVEAAGRRPNTNVNRDRKTDRLPVLGGTDSATPALTNNTTVVRKNAASPELANGTPPQQKAFDVLPATKRMPHCEPVASPFVDPALARIIGRCFV